MVRRATLLHSFHVRHYEEVLEMSTSRFARFVVPPILLVSLLTLLTVSVSTLVPRNSVIGAESASPKVLTVHEWGTFTSVTGADGQALRWRPLTVESDVPSFVHSIDKRSSWGGLRHQSKSGMAVRVRMETPVIYFYSDEHVQVSVKVDFRGGKITEWFPMASKVGGERLEWNDIEIIPLLHTNLPHDARESHYYPARETDAAVLQVRSDPKVIEHEKFLFYRGVGDFSLPVTVQLIDNNLTIKDPLKANVKKVIIFENRDGHIGYQIRELHDGELTVERPSLDGKLEPLLEDLKAMLIAEGLFRKEAEAMLQTWRNSWFEPGLRVFYIMPREATDQILPIDINPEPEKLERVLVGRAEIITSEMERDVTKQIAKLEDTSAVVRKTARSEIFKYGRFLEPLLAQISKHSHDARVKAGVEKLFNEMPR